MYPLISPTRLISEQSTLYSENSARREAATAAAAAASVGFGGWLTAKTVLHIMYRIDTRARSRAQRMRKCNNRRYIVAQRESNDECI